MKNTDSFLGWKQCGTREYKVFVQNHDDAFDYINKNMKLKNYSPNEGNFSTYFSTVDEVESFLNEMVKNFDFEEGDFEI